MRKLDGKTLMELILLVIAVIFWGLRKFGVLTAPWALMVAALSLAVSMGLLGMGLHRPEAEVPQDRGRAAAGLRAVTDHSWPDGHAGLI